MKELKVGIAGCGKVADLHAAALKNSSYGCLAAASSRTFAKARTFGEKYGANGYAETAEMVRSESLDAVIVCTPHPAHVEPTVAALEAGAHVLVEKPLAVSLDDCDRMIATAEKHSRKLGIMSQRRFYAPCQRIRKAIDEGRIGKPILGSITLYGWRDEAYYRSDPWRGTWKDEGGGVLVNQAPHQLDLLQWFMGEIDELFGYWANLNHPYIEVEDTAVAVIRFKNGALGNILLSNSQNPALYGKVMIHGSTGATIGVQTDGGAMFIAGTSEIEESPYNDHWTIPGEEEKLPQWQAEDRAFFKKVKATEYYHQLQIDDFLAAIQEDRDPLVTGRTGRVTVEIFNAIYRAQRDQKPVKFPL